MVKEIMGAFPFLDDEGFLLYDLALMCKTSVEELKRRGMKVMKGLLEILNGETEPYFKVIIDLNIQNIYFVLKCIFAFYRHLFYKYYSFLFIQEDTWVMNVLDYVFFATTPKNKKLKNKPFIKKVDQDMITEDLTSVCTKVENGAPMLYLFFKGDRFDCGIISADERIIFCKTSVESAVLAFIGVYSVFHVGYAQDHAHFLSFLEVAFLKKDTSACVNHPIGWTELLKKLTDLIESVEDF